MFILTTDLEKKIARTQENLMRELRNMASLLVRFYDNQKRYPTSESPYKHICALDKAMQILAKALQALPKAKAEKAKSHVILIAGDLLAATAYAHQELPLEQNITNSDDHTDIALHALTCANAAFTKTEDFECLYRIYLQKSIKIRAYEENHSIFVFGYFLVLCLQETLLYYLLQENLQEEELPPTLRTHFCRNLSSSAHISR